jgi:hypothetical protein
MSDILLDLPSHLRDRLVSALECGLLGPSPTLASLRSVLGNREDAAVLATSLVELGRLGISGPAAAAWFRTVERAAARTRKPDLVWSGPEVPGLHARDTRRVYEELLGVCRALDLGEHIRFVVPRHGFPWERGRFSGALFRGKWHVGYGEI